MDWDHSDYCQKVIPRQYENMGDIEGEVNNYKHFRKQIIRYLEKQPLIKYSVFKKKLIHIIIKINVYLLLKIILLKIFTIIGEEIQLFLKIFNIYK